MYITSLFHVIYLCMLRDRIFWLFQKQEYIYCLYYAHSLDLKTTIANTFLCLFDLSFSLHKALYCPCWKWSFSEHQIQDFATIHLSSLALNWFSLESPAYSHFPLVLEIFKICALLIVSDSYYLRFSVSLRLHCCNCSSWSFFLDINDVLIWQQYIISALISYTRSDALSNFWSYISMSYGWTVVS